MVAGQGSRAENRTLQDFSADRSRRIPMPARSDTELGGCTSLVCHNQGRLLHYTPTPFSLSQRPSFASFRMLQFIIGQTVLTQRLAIHWGRRSQLSSWRAETPGQGGSPPSCGNSSSGPSLGLGAGQCHNFTTSCHHNCFQIRHQKYNFHRELSIE